MNTQEILRNQIERYLLEHPVDRNTPNCYGGIAKEFGVDSELVRRIYRKLRRKGLVEAVAIASQAENYFYQTLPLTFIESKTTTSPPYDGSYWYKENGDSASLTQELSFEIKNEEQLVKDCNIDTNKWFVESWEVKRYSAWIKKDGEIHSEPKYSVYVKLKKRKLDSDLQLQKQVILDEIKNESKDVSSFHTLFHPNNQPIIKKEYLYEISVPDAHFGKMSWKEESGEDYDIKIASDRYNDAINGLLETVDLRKVQKILFPIGNDMINIDSRNNETFAGTKQDSDSRFFKIIKTVKNILIENIDKLSQIAPVDVLVISGNHDPESMFMIGEILDAYYHNNVNVTVNNKPTQRKYYKYGVNGFQYTHGNEEKHTELGLIFATEQAQLWADTKYRVCKLGHYHKTKKLNFVSVDEFQGFQVQILPSLSGTDAWHNSKGYMSKKAAKGFLYHYDKGLIAEYTQNV